MTEVVIEGVEPNSIHNQTDTLVLDTAVQQCNDKMQALCLFVATSETKKENISLILGYYIDNSQFKKYVKFSFLNSF